MGESNKYAEMVLHGDQGFFSLHNNKKLYGAPQFFRLVAPFKRLFGATQSFLEGGSIQEADFRVFFLLYGTPAPSSECQHPEAWPASTYGNLREGISELNLHLI